MIIDYKQVEISNLFDIGTPMILPKILEKRSTFKRMSRCG